jgi:hypothetical protein
MFDVHNFSVNFSHIAMPAPSGISTRRQKVQENMNL